MRKQVQGQFEASCRDLCSKYMDRTPAAGNQLTSIFKNDMSKQQAKEYWGNLWEDVLVENQVLLPRTIEGCPDIDARVEIWNLIHTEYGRGNIKGSRPYKFKTFLVSLGIPAKNLEFELVKPRPSTTQKMLSFQNDPWLETLTYYLAREVIGARNFSHLAEGLASSLRLEAGDLNYFNDLAEECKKSSESLFALISRYAESPEDRATVVKAFDKFFTSKDHMDMACLLRDGHNYDFRSPSTSRSAKRHGEILIPVMIESEGRRHECVADSISTSGLRILTEGANFPMNSSISIQIIDPGSDSSFAVVGTVVRTGIQVGSTPAYAGVEFDAEKTLKLSMGYFLGNIKKNVA